MGYELGVTGDQLQGLASSAYPYVAGDDRSPAHRRVVRKEFLASGRYDAL